MIDLGKMKLQAYRGSFASGQALDLIEAYEALQSRLESLEKDAARMDWLESSKESHGFCHSGYGEYRHYAHQTDGFKSVRETIDEAMQARQGVSEELK